MLKKDTVLYLIFLLFIVMTLVVATVQDEFTNGLTTEDLGFTDNQTIIRYIQIPQKATIHTSYLDMTPLAYKTIFFDNFDRANNDDVGNGWIETDGANSNVSIYNQNLTFMKDPTIATQQPRVSQNFTNHTYIFNHSERRIEIRYDMNHTGAQAAGYLQYSINIFANNTGDDTTQGLSIQFRPLLQTQVFWGDAFIDEEYNYSLTANDTIYSHYIIVNSTELNMRVWPREEAEPTYWNLTTSLVNQPINDSFGRYFTFRDTSQANSDGLYYIDNLNITNSTHLKNVKVQFGESDATYEYNSSTILLSKTRVNFTNTLRDTIASCDCTSCTLSSNQCTVPVFFSSDTNGTLMVNNINTNYTLFNSTINVTLLDANTLNKIPTINATVQIISDEFQAQSINEDSEHLFYANFSSIGNHDISLRAFQTNATDYSIVILEETVVQGLNYSYTMYLTNTSDVATTNLVTFVIQDQNRYGIEGAVLTIQKQDPTSATYLTLTELTSNSQGEATTILVTDTVFYKFIVTYQGDIIYTSSLPVTVSLNDDTIYLVGVISDYEDYVDNLLDTAVSLSYTNTSNKTGYFTLDYTGISTVESCLYIEIFNMTGRSFVEENCQNATSGSISSTDFSPNNRTLYNAIAFIDPKDGEGFRVGAILAHYIGEDRSILSKDNTMFFLLVVLLIAAFGFMASPIVGVIMLGVGGLIVSFMKLTAFGITEAMILMVVCIIVAISVSRVRRSE